VAVLGITLVEPLADYFEVRGTTSSREGWIPDLKIGEGFEFCPECQLTLFRSR
jgi:hypothetical protein